MNPVNGQICDMSNELSPLPQNPVVAMAYVPFQQFNTVYPSEQGFENGTIFPELNKPFHGRRVTPGE